nr:hypothetical protein [Tanacetum cinerariifolium]
MIYQIKPFALDNQGLSTIGAEDGPFIMTPFKVSALNVDFDLKIDLIVFGPETVIEESVTATRGSIVFLCDSAGNIVQLGIVNQAKPKLLLRSCLRFLYRHINLSEDDLDLLRNFTFKSTERLKGSGTKPNSTKGSDKSDDEKQQAEDVKDAYALAEDEQPVDDQHGKVQDVVHVHEPQVEKLA